MKAARVDDLQADFWRNYVHVGTVTYSLGGVAALAYILATPHGPHRGILLVLDASTVAASFGIFWWLGIRLVPTRWRTPFFSSWTVSTFAFIGLGAILDGGTDSPMSYLLVLPLLFAGLAYPPRTVSTLTAVGMITATLVGVLAHHVSPASTVMLVTSLLIAGVLTAAFARSRGRLTDALVDGATHDDLTRCLTRRAFYDRLDHELARSRRYGKPFSVFLADLDNLKMLNDHWGHESGDEALRLLSGALRSEARGTDLVGRLGGDEFGVILPETSAADAAGVAERLLGAVRDADGAVSVTASIGSATWQGPGETTASLVHRADGALFAAKKAGRDAYRCADPSDDAQSRLRDTGA